MSATVSLIYSRSVIYFYTNTNECYNHLAREYFKKKLQVLRWKMS